MKNYIQNQQLMLPCQIGEVTLSKSKFFFDIEGKRELILQTTFKSYFFVKHLGLFQISIHKIKYKYKVQVPKETKRNQVDTANTKNKLGSETRPEEGNNSLN